VTTGNRSKFQDGTAHNLVQEVWCCCRLARQPAQAALRKGGGFKNVGQGEGEIKSKPSFRVAKLKEKKNP